MSLRDITVGKTKQTGRGVVFLWHLTNQEFQRKPPRDEPQLDQALPHFCFQHSQNIYLETLCNKQKKLQR